MVRNVILLVVFLMVLRLVLGSSDCDLCCLSSCVFFWKVSQISSGLNFLTV
jgi:hypothetical protein